MESWRDLVDRYVEGAQHRHDTDARLSFRIRRRYRRRTAGAKIDSDNIVTCQLVILLNCSAVGSVSTALVAPRTGLGVLPSQPQSSSLCTSASLDGICGPRRDSKVQSPFQRLFEQQPVVHGMIWLPLHQPLHCTRNRVLLLLPFVWRQAQEHSPRLRDEA